METSIIERKEETADDTFELRPDQWSNKDKCYINDKKNCPNELQPTTCIICLDNVSVKDIANKNCVNCIHGHKFHKRHEHDNYIIIYDLNKCPVCRVDMPFYQSLNIYDTTVA